MLALRTHQELLDAFVDAERAVIGEYSVNINHDLRELVEAVEAYAKAHRLNTDALDGIRELVRDAESYA